MKQIKKALFFVLIFVPFITNAQKQRGKEGSGMLELGMRSTASLFSDAGYTGRGVGGQFRLNAGKKVNTEWYSDYITTDIGGLGVRRDLHIGWSVMFYLLNEERKQNTLTPYILAGHCFDYTRVLETGNKSNFKERYNSAVQMGIGTHYNITERVDLSLTAQYMNHLGRAIHSNIIGGTDSMPRKIDIYRDEKKLSLEGHLLVTLSLNVKLIDLW